jgi:hypothetical protein
MHSAIFRLGHSYGPSRGARQHTRATHTRGPPQLQKSLCAPGSSPSEAYPPPHSLGAVLPPHISAMARHHRGSRGGGLWGLVVYILAMTTSNLPITRPISWRSRSRDRGGVVESALQKCYCRNLRKTFLSAGCKTSLSRMRLLFENCSAVK